MEITIKINGQAVSVAVTVEVYGYLDQAAPKDENLANECSCSYILTPEQIVCRKETLAEIMAVLNACTKRQRQRFFLYTLECMSYEEIGRYCGCSKVAVHHSISAVRKKYYNFINQTLNEMPFSG